ncbi:MAG: hypothetical protein K6F01_02005 [Selenomonas sp.]|uniref:hypothetical protein n=1 Tax=Selenomonas sp. TaxID=2053611 RepID=UPI0025DB463B|nr:hypothetical protein [Selenomonas sp.]MCR5438208.1 hypothetical protein [Selenomonas sp.]
MGINAISGIGAMQYDNQYSDSSTGNKSKESPGDFREILAKATVRNESEEKQVAGTITVTKLLPDGTLVVRRMQGERILSERKLSGATVQQQQNWQVAGNSFAQAYLAGNRVAAGSLFSATV